MLPHIVTMLGAAAVAFLVTRWTAPSAALRQATHPAKSVAVVPYLRAGRRTAGTGAGPDEDGSQPTIPPSAALLRQDDGTAAREFRASLEQRFASAPVGGPSVELFKERIRLELMKGAEEFPLVSRAEVLCRLGICRIQLPHSDAAGSQRFHHGLLAGRFLNRPEFLNQDNGCNLHAFVADGEGSSDTFYVECREGR